MDDFPSNTSIYKGFSMARLNKQMVYYIYIDPRGLGFSDGGGVGWGGACYRHDATLMGGVGWGRACYRHVHVTLMLR